VRTARGATSRFRRFRPNGRRVAGMVATMTYATTVVVIYAPGVIGVLWLAAAGLRRKAR